MNTLEIINQLPVSNLTPVRNETATGGLSKLWFLIGIVKSYSLNPSPVLIAPVRIVSNH